MWTTTLWIVHIVHELYIIPRNIISVSFRRELFATSLLVIFAISCEKALFKEA